MFIKKTYFVFSSSNRKYFQRYLEYSDTFVKGQLLFIDKNMPVVKFTAPGTGRIKAIHREERSKLLSVEIELSGTEEISLFKLNHIFARSKS